MKTVNVWENLHNGWVLAGFVLVILAGILKTIPTKKLDNPAVERLLHKGVNFFFVLGIVSIVLGFVVPERTSTGTTEIKQTISHTSGNAINVGGDVNLTIVQQSDEYQELKWKVDNARRNLVKLPNDPDFQEELQKAEKNLNDFIEGIRKLLAEIDRIPLNSERGAKARQYFEQGKYQEAREILDEKEMNQEKQAWLKVKEQGKKQVEEATANLDSLAVEYIFKAKLTALDYQLGVVSPNRRKFRQPNSSPATIASRSMTWPSP